jgi:hypothetical protein
MRHGRAGPGVPARLQECRPGGATQHRGTGARTRRLWGLPTARCAGGLHPVADNCWSAPVRWSVTVSPLTARPPVGGPRHCRVRQPAARCSMPTAASDFRQTTAQQATAVRPPSRLSVSAPRCPTGGASVDQRVADERAVRHQTTVKAITDKDGYSGSWSITSYAIWATAPAWLARHGYLVEFRHQPDKDQDGFYPAGQSPIGGGWSPG